MTQKFAADSIGSDKRASVVFCKFAQLPSLRMRGKRRTYGLTYPALGDDDVKVAEDGTILWREPFIIVNLGLERVHVIAHEVVHAAGDRHPFPIGIYRVGSTTALRTTS